MVNGVKGNILQLTDDLGLDEGVGRRGLERHGDVALLGKVAVLHQKAQLEHVRLAEGKMLSIARRVAYVSTNAG